MDFTETLLQNEVEHLNKSFHLLSSELLLIQEFLKSEYGMKYLAFRNARKEQKEVNKTNQQNRRRFPDPQSIVTTETSTSHQRLVQPDTSRLQDHEAMQTITSGEEESSEEVEEDANYNESLFLFPEETESNKQEDNHHVDIKPDIIITHADLQQPIIQPGKPGRRKTIIHEYFEKITDDDGKIKTKCFRCGSFVSDKAPRLRTHLIKCRSGIRPKLTGVGAGSRPSSSIIFKTQMLDASALNHKNKQGRKFDTVRLLYSEVKDVAGFVKMKCSQCGNLVSNKTPRMRKHLEKCEGNQNQEILLNEVSQNTNNVPASTSVNPNNQNSETKEIFSNISSKQTTHPQNNISLLVSNEIPDSHSAHHLVI